MLSRLLHQRDLQAGVAPAASSLQVGELFLNSADAALYTKQPNLAVTKIAQAADTALLTQLATDVAALLASLAEHLSTPNPHAITTELLDTYLSDAIDGLVDARIARSGDTMTGNLTIETPLGQFTLLDPDTASSAAFRRYDAATVALHHLRGTAGSANLDLAPTPSDLTSEALIRLFRTTNTTGALKLVFCRGNNTTTELLSLRLPPDRTRLQIQGSIPVAFETAVSLTGTWQLPVQLGAAYLWWHPIASRIYVRYGAPPASQDDGAIIALVTDTGETLLSTTNLIAGAATQDLILPAPYTRFRVAFHNLVPSTSANLRLRVSTNSGATYSTSSIYNSATFFDLTAAGGQVRGPSSDNVPLNGSIHIIPSSADYQAIVADNLCWQDTNNGRNCVSALHTYNATTPINALRLYWSSGNHHAGQLRLYGQL